MPYINKEERSKLDQDIENLISTILTLDNCPDEFQNHLGRINYCFSRILCGVMGSVNYAKIAMATGVIENIKQEFYRRLASRYEDMKITDNGDIIEYKK